MRPPRPVSGQSCCRGAHDGCTCRHGNAAATSAREEKLADSPRVGYQGKSSPEVHSGGELRCVGYRDAPEEQLGGLGLSVPKRKRRKPRKMRALPKKSMICSGPDEHRKLDRHRAKLGFKTKDRFKGKQPKKPKRRLGRKFDSTKGYPGEGPQYRRCDIAHCLIAGHYHSKPLSGYLRRKREEEKREPKDRVRLYKCNVLTAAQCPRNKLEAHAHDETQHMGSDETVHHLVVQAPELQAFDATHDSGEEDTSAGDAKSEHDGKSDSSEDFDEDEVEAVSDVQQVDVDAWLSDYHKLRRDDEKEAPPEPSAPPLCDREEKYPHEPVEKAPDWRDCVQSNEPSEEVDLLRKVTKRVFYNGLPTEGTKSRRWFRRGCRYVFYRIFGGKESRMRLNREAPFVQQESIEGRIAAVPSVRAPRLFRALGMRTYATHKFTDDNRFDILKSVYTYERTCQIFVKLYEYACVDKELNKRIAVLGDGKIATSTTAAIKRCLQEHPSYALFKSDLTCFRNTKDFIVNQLVVEGCRDAMVTSGAFECPKVNVGPFLPSRNGDPSSA